MLLEKVRYVEEWFLEYFFLYQIEWDEKTTDTTISIEKWMDSFELVMRYCDFHKVRKFELIIMKKLF